jgi:Pyridoxamine 5'-phosphate oxidase
MVDERDIERALWALRAYDTIALATVSGLGPHVAAFFFAPERTATGVRLLIATTRDSRKLREIVADPRVAFLCFPGNATRWITGSGSARALDDEAGTTALSVRLPAHAPGARTFIEAADSVAVEVVVRHLEVVEAIDTPVLVYDFDD